MRRGAYSLSVAFALSAGVCLAQLASSVTLSNGIEIKVVASLGVPTGEEKLRVEMSRASGESFYRIFRDQNNLMVYAYELGISRSANGRDFHFVAKPVETEFAAKFPDADAGKPVPTLSADHEFKTLQAGGGDDIKLFDIPGMGLDVSDHIQVVQAPQTASATAGSFQLSELKVSINGAPPIGPVPGSVSGRYAMLYIPGQGGFFFSTDAPEGRAFVKAGSIDRNRMKFTVDNISFDCSSAQPILVHSESGELWVFHDPAYLPAGNWTQAKPTQTKPEFFTAASDSLNWWLP